MSVCMIIALTNISSLAMNPEVKLRFEEDGYKEHKVVFCVYRDESQGANSYDIGITLSPPIDMPAFDYYGIIPSISVESRKDLTEFDGLAVPEELYDEINVFSSRLQHLSREILNAGPACPQHEYEMFRQRENAILHNVDEILFEYFSTII